MTVEQDDVKRHKSPAEEMFEELKNLRQTEPEFLLEETIRRHQARDAAQTNLIEQLRERVTELERKLDTHNRVEDELSSEVVALKESNAKLATELAEAKLPGREPAQNVRDAQSPDAAAELEALESKAQALADRLAIFYAITGMNCKISPDGRTRFFRVRNQAAALTFSYKLRMMGDDNGDVEYVPMSDASMLPSFLQTSMSVDEANVATLQAHIQYAIFCSPQAAAPPAESADENGVACGAPAKTGEAERRKLVALAQVNRNL